MGRIGLSKEVILKALQELSEALAKRDVKGELCLFGGSVMVLAYAARVSTKDVDAIFQPATLIRSLAAQIGENNDLPQDWLNDGVKGFISRRNDLIKGNLPQFVNLALTMPTPEYLLAMKCMASRINPSAGEEGDVRDIIYLIRHLNLKTIDAVMDLVNTYYPENQVPIKARYLVEGLFAEKKI
jgi:Nucleotidyltransferase of unknown function (DUF6036)